MPSDNSNHICITGTSKAITSAFLCETFEILFYRRKTEKSFSKKNYDNSYKINCIIHGLNWTKLFLFTHQ